MGGEEIRTSEFDGSGWVGEDGVGGCEVGAVRWAEEGAEHVQ